MSQISYRDVIAKTERKIAKDELQTRSRQPLFNWADVTAFTEEEQSWWDEFEADCQSSSMVVNSNNELTSSLSGSASANRIEESMKQWCFQAFNNHSLLITASSSNDEIKEDYKQKSDDVYTQPKKPLQSQTTTVESRLHAMVENLSESRSKLDTMHRLCLTSENECDEIEKGCVMLVREQGNLGSSLKVLSECVATLRRCHALRSRLNSLTVSINSSMRMRRLNSTDGGTVSSSTSSATTNTAIRDSAVAADGDVGGRLVSSSSVSGEMVTSGVSESQMSLLIDIANQTEECSSFINRNAQCLVDSEREFAATLSSVRSDCISLIRRLVFESIDECTLDASSSPASMLRMRFLLASVRPLVACVERLSPFVFEYLELLSSIILRLRQVRSPRLIDWLRVEHGQAAHTAAVMMDDSSMIQSHDEDHVSPSDLSVVGQTRTGDGSESLLTALNRLCDGVFRGCAAEAKLFTELCDLNFAGSLSYPPSPGAAAHAGPDGLNSTVKVSGPQSATMLGSGPHSAGVADQVSHTLGIAAIGDDSSVLSAIQSTHSDLCLALYDHFRPRIIHEEDMTMLCDVIGLLQQILVEHSPSMSESEDLLPMAESLKDSQQKKLGSEEAEQYTNLANDATQKSGKIAVCAVAERLMADTQERLVYRTQIVIRETIANNLTSSVSKESTSLKSGGHGGDWHSVVQCTLDVLSSIFPVLQKHVFEWLSFECVSHCVHSLLSIARQMANQQGSVHGQLFLIKHLLVLREQISPFKVQLCQEEHSLDFSHMAEYAASLVSASSNQSYSIVEMLGRAVPTVSTHRLNTRKSMDDLLKRTCEALISTQTNLLVGSLIKVVRSGNLSKETSPAADGNTIVSGAGRIAQSAFVERLNAALSQSETSLVMGVGRLSDTMKSYLRNPSTCRILLRPIVANIQGAFVEMRRVVAQSGLRHQVSLAACETIIDQLRKIASCTETTSEDGTAAVSEVVIEESKE